jgi:hypothetical protein
MANEITLDPYGQVEGEFTAEELDSLRVGEEMAEAESQLLAGKYQSAEELERGYLELQKRLSGGQEPEEDAPDIQEEDDTEYEEEGTEEAPDGLYEQLLQSYRDGEWDPELVEKVEGMNPIDVLNLMLENGSQQQQPTATEQDVFGIQESVGGQEEYQNMLQWASQNLSEQEINLYDAAMDKGDPLTMFFAAQALFARYQDGVGYDGELLTGSAPQSTSQGFRSQAELIAAMSDPRYDKDPAYRADVADKLAVSNI